MALSTVENPSLTLGSQCTSRQNLEVRKTQLTLKSPFTGEWEESARSLLLGEENGLFNFVARRP